MPLKDPTYILTFYLTYYYWYLFCIHKWQLEQKPGTSKTQTHLMYSEVIVLFFLNVAVFITALSKIHYSTVTEGIEVWFIKKTQQLRMASVGGLSSVCRVEFMQIASCCIFMRNKMKYICWAETFSEVTVWAVAVYSTKKWWKNLGNDYCG